MTFDTHPIFVHFPIALLALYSFIKIVPLKRWFPNISWKNIELFLLVFGVGGAFAGLYTGQIARELMRGGGQLLRTHSDFAQKSTFLYSLLLIGEILALLNPLITTKLKPSKTISLSVYIEKIITSPIVSNIIALLGLVAISITGLLGGVLVYGLSADPFAAIVMKLLGLTVN